MPTTRSVRRVRAFLVVVLMCGAATSALAFPSRWTSRCASCHSNDTPTCNGCHHHSGSINAVADQPTYSPGSLVTITLTGGTQSGWIRGLLFDQQQVEIDRATGPTGMGDDSLPNPVTFPVTLSGLAPTQPGTYVWRAAWFGGEDSGGGNHLQLSDNVTIVVEGTVGVPDTFTPGAATWGDIKSLFD